MLSPLIRSKCNFLFSLFICSKIKMAPVLSNHELKSQVPCPKHTCPFYKGLSYHDHVHSIKSWDGCIFKFCDPFCFFTLFSFNYLCVLTHTHIINADSHSLWILLITILLLPVMTLKIRSTKLRTKVRKIVKYQGNLQGY